MSSNPINAGAPAPSTTNVFLTPAVAPSQTLQDIAFVTQNHGLSLPEPIPPRKLPQGAPIPRPSGSVAGGLTVQQLPYHGLQKPDLAAPQPLPRTLSANGAATQGNAGFFTQTVNALNNGAAQVLDRVAEFGERYTVQGPRHDLVAAQAVHAAEGIDDAAATIRGDSHLLRPRVLFKVGANLASAYTGVTSLLGTFSAEHRSGSGTYERTVLRAAGSVVQTIASTGVATGVAAGVGAALAGTAAAVGAPALLVGAVAYGAGIAAGAGVGYLINRVLG